jgi:hypothetical protein
MVFNVGYNRHIDVRAQKEFSFVMCKIAVGKSIVILKENIEINQLIFLKDLTQSIYIVMNKVHKYFFINMLYLKTIKFIQAI